jgi:hypothetical protein
MAGRWAPAVNAISHHWNRRPIMNVHIFWQSIIRAAYTIGFTLLGMFVTFGAVAHNWQAIGLNQFYAALIAGAVYGIKKALTKDKVY